MDRRNAFSKPPRCSTGSRRRPDGVKAEYRDGILALVLPRAESEKPKTIKIG